MARNIGVNFNGKRIVRPGAHGRIDASGLGVFGSNTEKKVVFLGTSEGGEPGKYHEFNGYSEARDVLRGGDLLTAGNLAWTPSGDGVGAGTIGFIRVEDATQATLKKNGLTIKSHLYGEEANQIQVKLEDGTVEGSKRLTVHHWRDNSREIYDNIGPVFKIAYTGADPEATVTIKKDEKGQATQISLEVGKAVIRVFQLGDASEFPEANKLINEINELPDFKATITEAGNKIISTKDLDAVEKQDIKKEFTITAFEGDLRNQMVYSKLVTAVVEGEFPENFNFEYLSGGLTEQAPASWVDKLDLIKGEGAYIVVPLTKDEAIHAEVARFVERESTSEENEMRTFYGGGLGESIETTINRAVTLNSSRASICYPAITRKLSDNEVETLPAYFTAAIVAGRVAGLEIGEPATFDYLNLIGVERILTSSEIDKLIENGVTPIEYVRSRNRRGFRIAQCVTTYQEDNNPAFRENSMGELSDFLNMELREHLESRFVGTKGTAITASLIKNETQSFLDQKVRDQWLVEYDPASVDVQGDGDVFRVNYSAHPVHSVNYILITASYYRNTLTA